MPAYGLIKVFTPAFFARGDTRTPVKVAILAMVLNILFNLILMRFLLQVGIALGTALAAWVNVGVLVGILYHRGFFQFDSLALRRVPLLLLSGLAEAFVLWFSWHWAEPHFAAGGLLLRTAIVAALIAGGAGCYFALALVLGAVPREAMTRLVRRRRREVLIDSCVIITDNKPS